MQVMRKMNERTSSGNERTSPDSQPTNQDDTCSSDAAFLDLITDTNNSCSMQISSNEPPDPMTIFVGDFIDVSLLEGNAYIKCMADKNTREKCVLISKET